MFAEKSPDLRYYQLKLVEARLLGDRRNVGWFLRCAADYRRIAARKSDRHEPEWEHSAPRTTRYVNG